MDKKQNKKLTTNLSSNQTRLDLEQKISDVLDEEELLSQINSYHRFKQSNTLNSIFKSGSCRKDQSGRAENGQNELNLNIGLSLLKSNTESGNAGDAQNMTSNHPTHYSSDKQASTKQNPSESLREKDIEHSQQNFLNPSNRSSNIISRRVTEDLKNLKKNRHSSKGFKFQKRENKETIHCSKVNCMKKNNEEDQGEEYEMTSGFCCFKWKKGKQ